MLHYACMQGQTQLVTELLQAGVSVDMVGGKLKHTPLMLGEWALSPGLDGWVVPKHFYQFSSVLMTGWHCSINVLYKKLKNLNFSGKWSSPACFRHMLFFLYLSCQRSALMAGNNAEQC